MKGMVNMTIKEMRNEINRIKEANYHAYNSGVIIKIMNRQADLMRAKGYERSYLNKNEKKQYIMDYLETYINASYDITGSCL